MHRIYMVTLFCFILTGCDKTMEISEYKATDSGKWKRDNGIGFSFSEMDTIGSHNMFINIRNDNRYPYNNLFLIAELAAPDGNITIDTLEYEMAKTDGTWLGKGYGSVKENKLWYKENIVFPSSGVYTLTIYQAMRRNGNVEGIEELEGITDVGFEISKSNQ